MRTLTNLMGSHITSDDIAEAVLAYHDALVARKSVDLVEIPVVGEERRVRRATLAIGWLTGLIAGAAPMSSHETEQGVEDQAVASDLHALAVATRSA